MKPSTKFEKRVTELSATLSPIRQNDADWINNDFKSYYKKKGICYYLILERCKEWQVLRYYYITRLRFFEFMQVWLNADGRQVILAKKRHMRVDGWMEDSEMSVWRQRQYIEYSYLGGVERIGFSGYKVRSLLPELKRRGLKTSTHGMNPRTLCIALLTSNRIETLFKLKQYKLVHYFCYGYRHMSDLYWHSIRVALRHGYHWDNKQELSDWCDLVCDLYQLGLDTRSPHYICPANLIEAHNYYRERRRMIEEGKRLQAELQEIMEYEPTFKQNREQFFGMTFQSGKVTIQIIPTAMAIKEEGIAMHHCVGGYYNRLDSLILSAKVNGKRMETIEVNLNTYEIVQSRGLQNTYTNYHNKIMHLMKQGLPEIRNRNEQHKTKIAV